MAEGVKAIREEIEKTERWATNQICVLARLIKDSLDLIADTERVTVRCGELEKRLEKIEEET